MQRKIYLIIFNVRSAHNVGSLLRTADGLGISKLFLSGYSPYPAQDKDARLPHEASKVNNQIHKTALGAENTVNWKYVNSVLSVIEDLRAKGFQICALEQSTKAVNLNDYMPQNNVAIIVGNELAGVGDEILQNVDVILEIPMLGKKESFNVAQATAMALYHLRFH